MRQADKEMICIFMDWQKELCLAQAYPMEEAPEKPDLGTDFWQLSFFDFSLSRETGFFLKPICRGEEQILAQLSEQWKSSQKKSIDIEWRWKEPVREQFSRYFEILKDSIAQGKTQKAVPVCFAESQVELSYKDRFRILKNLIENKKFGFPLIFVSKDFEYYGLSPELLFEKRGQDLHTMALAGTYKLGEDFGEEAFLNDPKEQVEHRFVVDSIHDLLAPLGKVELSEPHILKLNSIAHIKTDLKMKLEQVVTEKDLVKRLHPTPALGDYPRGSMKDWFQSMDEELDRDLFGAPILLKDGEGSSRCVVGIRCLYKKKDSWKLGSGCGVVEKSLLDREWVELQNKRDSVKSYLGIL